jgi:RHS repeat-associated protein
MNMRGKLPAVLLISIALLLPATLSAEVFYYHNDHLGTPLAMTDANGDVVWGANELPFGEHHSGIFLPIGTKVVENDRRFLGKEYDKETGLIYLGQRYLDPATGRFNRPDPVGLVNPSTAEINQEMLHNPQRLNRYVYSLNNPYRFVDPDGEYAIAIPAIGGGIIIGLAYYALSPPETKQAFSDSLRPIFHNESNEERTKEEHTERTPENNRPIETGQDAQDQLEGVEKAQNDFRQGKRDKPVDFTDKSKQRLTKKFKDYINSTPQEIYDEFD